jgi:hypothetical protein
MLNNDGTIKEDFSDVIEAYHDFKNSALKQNKKLYD